jgi:hypothetical protein
MGDVFWRPMNVALQGHVYQIYIILSCFPCLKGIYHGMHSNKLCRDCRECGHGNLISCFGKSYAHGSAADRR